MIKLFTGKAGRDIVAIELSDKNIKIAHIRAFAHRKEIVNLTSRHISGLSDTEVSQEIKTALGSIKAKHAEYITLVPSAQIITKNIEIPSTNPSEIREIINLQAGRHTPFSKDEIIIDYAEIGSYKHSYTKILLVIIARQIVKRQLELIGRAGVSLERVVLAQEGLGLFLSKMAHMDTSGYPLGIVNIDESFTDFSVVFKNKLLFIRSIPVGAMHLLDDRERYERRFAEEIKRSLEAYQSEDIDKMPMTLTVTGSNFNWKDFESGFSEVILTPLQFSTYYTHLFIDHDAKEMLIHSQRTSFLNALTTSLVAGELKVNLVPEEIKMKQSLQERAKDLMRAGIYVLTAFLMICLIVGSRFYFKNEYLSRLRDTYAPVHLQARGLQKELERITLIRKYVLERGLGLEILTELHELTPFSILLSDIRYEEGERVSLRGTSESMSSVFTFVDSLENSEYFKDVKTRYTTKRKDGSKDVTDFEIVCSPKAFSND